MNANYSLLLGLVAHHLGFITRGQLVAALSHWVKAKSKPIDVILSEQGVLDEAQRSLLLALVEKHLAIHGGDPQKCLNSLGSISSLIQELETIADSELETTLRCLSTEPEDDTSIKVSTLTAGTSSSTSERFSILRPHAEGGLGQVSVALDLELHREVALKEIRPEHAGDQGCRTRFIQEAEITGKLEHPGIVPVYGLGFYGDGRPFYAMRFVKGDSLKAAIQAFHQRDSDRESTTEGSGRAQSWASPGARSLELRKLLGRFIDVCNAIGYAHSRGVLHRDLKPGNVMLGKHGETLVVDWGLAKPIGREEATQGRNEPARPLEIAAGAIHTQAGSALGTPAYMSPEQAAGQHELLGSASDVYSLGATLYCLLTGRPPFTDTDPLTVLSKVQTGDFLRPREIKRTVPRALEAICLKAMSLRPEDRCASPELLAEDLEHWMADEPVSAYRGSASERFARWTRRHRAWTQAAIISLAVITAVAVVAAVLINQARKETARQRESAEARRQIARAYWYDSDLRLAWQAWEANNIRHAKELLNRQRPLEPDEDLRGFEWYVLWRQHDQARLTLQDHPTAVKCLAFSPDNNLLASGGSRDRNLSSGVVKVWDPKSGRLLKTLSGHHKPVLCLAFSPDGNLLATGSGDLLPLGNPAGEIFLWDIKEGRIVGTLTGQRSAILGLAFTADGKSLAACGGATYKQEPGEVKVWDLASHELEWDAPGLPRAVTAIGFSPDDSLLGTADFAGTVRLFERNTNRATVFQASRTTRCLAFSHHGKQLVTGDFDGWMLWDYSTGTQPFVRATAGEKAKINSVVFTADDRALITGGSPDIIQSGGEVRIWRLGPSTPKSQLLRGHEGAVDAVACSSDGRMIASGGDDASVKLWDPLMEGIATLLTGRTEMVSDVAYAPKANILVSSGQDRMAILWDMATLHQRLRIQGRQPFLRLALTKDGSLLASCGLDKVVHLWDARTGIELPPLEPFRDLPKTVAFSPDDEWLVAVGGMQTGEIKIWSVRDRKLAGEWSAHSATVFDAAFSPDGTVFATAGGDGLVKVWNVQNRQEVMALQAASSGGLYAVTFSANGQMIATCGYEKIIKIIDLKSGRVSMVLSGHRGPIHDVVFLPGDRCLASASLDKTVKIWDLQTGQELVTLPCENSALALAFATGGQWLAVAQEKAVMLWRAATRTEAILPPVERLQAALAGPAQMGSEPALRHDSAMSPSETSPLQAALNDARWYGWRVVIAVTPLLQERDASRYPAVAVLAKQLRRLANQFNAQQSDRRWQAIHPHDLVEDNPAFWRAAFEMAPGDPVFLLLHAALLLAAGEIDRASYFIALAPYCTESSLWGDLYSELSKELNRVYRATGPAVRQGQSLENQGRFAEAVKQYESIFKTWPQCGYARYLAAISARRMGDQAAAEMHFARARYHAPLSMHAFQGSAQRFAKLMNVQSVWSKINSGWIEKTPDRLSQLSEACQQESMDEIALVTRRLLAAGQNGYSEVDRRFIRLSLERLVPSMRSDNPLRELEGSSIPKPGWE